MLTPAIPYRPSDLRCYAFNLLAALDAYELASTQLVETWLDTELYAEVASKVEEIRAHGMTDPLLTVVSLQLVIAHSELVSTLWQNCSEAVPPVKLAQARQRQALAITAVRVVAAKMLRVD